MRLGTRLDPRAKERLRRVSSSGGDEFVGRLTEGPVRTKSDRSKADVESLVLDDLVGAAVLGGGVGVGSVKNQDSSRFQESMTVYGYYSTS